MNVNTIHSTVIKTGISFLHFVLYLEIETVKEINCLIKMTPISIYMYHLKTVKRHKGHQGTITRT